MTSTMLVDADSSKEVNNYIRLVLREFRKPKNMHLAVIFFEWNLTCNSLDLNLKELDPIIMRKKNKEIVSMTTRQLTPFLIKCFKLCGARSKAELMAIIKSKLEMNAIVDNVRTFGKVFTTRDVQLLNDIFRLVNPKSRSNTDGLLDVLKPEVLTRVNKDKTAENIDYFDFCEEQPPLFEDMQSPVELEEDEVSVAEDVFETENKIPLKSDKIESDVGIEESNKVYYQKSKWFKFFEEITSCKARLTTFTTKTDHKDIGVIKKDEMEDLQEGLCNMQLGLTQINRESRLIRSLLTK